MPAAARPEDSAGFFAVFSPDFLSERLERAIFVFFLAVVHAVACQQRVPRV
jgi:hypothetical protein